MLERKLGPGNDVRITAFDEQALEVRIEAIQCGAETIEPFVAYRMDDRHPTFVPRASMLERAV
ncbi:hypothetical protein PBS_17370 [Paraburkholderia sp. 2C]